MDLGELLALLVATASGLTLFRLFRESRRGNKGWKVLSIVLLGASVASYVLLPVAGIACGAAWGVLFLLPLSLARRVTRAVLAQDYARAKRLAKLVALLHPLDGLRDQPRALEALEAAHRGEIDRAQAILAPDLERPGPLAALATLQLYRVRGAWEELLAWLHAHYDQQTLEREPQLAGSYLRALAETGDLNDVIAIFERSSRSLESPGSALTLALVRLFLFAFAGDEASVRRLLDGTLASLPRVTREYWLATVRLAAGQVDQAKAELAKLHFEADAIAKTAVERRLTKPIAVARDVLTPASLAALERIKLAWDQDERYAGTIANGPIKGTVALTLINVAAFVLEVARKATSDDEGLVKIGALVPERVRAGEVWRLATGAFLHVNALHLGVNMLGLVLLGRLVEGTLRTGRFLTVYLTSALVSMAACAVVYTLMGRPDEVVLGASGAVMGLVGAIGAIAWRGVRQERARAAFRRLSGVVLILVLQSALDLSIKEVSFTGHLSGAIAGFLVAALLHHPGTARVVQGR